MREISLIPRWIKHKNTLNWLKAISIIALVLSHRLVWAEDILQGQDTNAKDTISGSVKVFVLIVDLVVATAVYAKTRNILSFVSGAVIYIAFSIYAFLWAK